ncbi:MULTISPECIES: 1-acyl-sn-glycerol-3-phosphate acyltransferase [unclassified Wenzhouxiangella]|uniref:lysophospholipid acyltransferase family protein n=1 Tax=unclassified Wenzhouxiangella TaxID=2613841 RepID=UPI0015F281E4|nr:MULTISPECIES: 1-acyl-sn-glycerol-3-phosphate acyltransferase [unclassified Wenzhouxiangella]
MSEPEHRVPAFRTPWRLIWRVPLFILHIFIGLPLTLLCFLPGIKRIPVFGIPLRERAHRTWQRITLRLFGVRMDISGQLPDGPALIVANHISWLDIVLLQALWPMWLVAKAEIRAWPLIGWLAEVGGTLFIVRGRLESRQKISRRMAALMRRGDRVGIFPEGGIRPDRGVNRFHAPLFAAAIRTRMPVVPVAIRYERGDDLHEEFVFGPGESFLRNFFRLMAEPPLTGRIMIGEPILDYDNGRRRLAEKAGAVVKDFYDNA